MIPMLKSKNHRAFFALPTFGLLKGCKSFPTKWARSYRSSQLRRSCFELGDGYLGQAPKP